MWNQETAQLPRQHSAHRRPHAGRRAGLLVAAAVVAVTLAVTFTTGWPGFAHRVSDGAANNGAVGNVSGAPVAGCPTASAPGDAPSSPSPSHCPPGLAPASPHPSAQPSTAPATSHPATATPTRTASAKPSPTPRPGGKPGPANTGVPAGTHLTVVTGDQIFHKPNQVISGLDVHGFVEIRAKNVTIKDSIIRGGPDPRCNSAVIWIRADYAASATISDTEIAPAHPSPCLDGIWATNATLIRMNIHGAVDGVKAYDNVTLEDSYVHDLSWFASDPNQGGGATHNDDVQTYEGNKHIVLRHNTMSPGKGGNSTYQVTQDGGKVSTDLHIEDNWLDGGGCTLNFSHKGGPTPMTGIYVVGNRFGRHSVFQCPILVSTQTFLSQDSGNVWDDTGKPIPPPQRHD